MSKLRNLSFGSTSLVRFSTKEQGLFAKRMSFLIQAGVPLLESLYIVRNQARSKGKLRIFDMVIDDVANGQYLSTGLGRFKRIFGEFAVGIIRVGEMSGTLAQNLLYLADELQKRHALRRKIIGAALYPLIVTVATLGVVSLLVAFIFPRVMPIFISLHVPLPMTTRLLLGLSQFLAVWGFPLCAGLILLICILIFVRRRFERVRYFGDWLLLRTPLAGTIARAYNLSNFCRILGLLLRSGTALSEATIIVAEVTNNRVYRAACIESARGIARGEPISRGLAMRRNLYPDMLVHLLSIGETTGNLAETLSYLSGLYEQEVDELTRALSSAIEPALMLMMGLLVGLIAVSVIAPIYEITQHLQPK